MNASASLAAAALLSLASLAATAPAAEQWPHWRGPDGNSAAPEATPPLVWSETENVN